MKTFFLICVILSSISFNACNNSKKATKDNANTASNASIKTDVDNYRLVLEFYSIGAGTDGSAINKFQSFLDNHPKKPTYDKMRWGREGECDYCLKLSELGKKEQAQFVEEVKKLLTSSQLVHIEENKPCKGTKID